MKGASAKAASAPVTADPYEAYCRPRNLRWPAGVWRRLNGRAGAELSELIYWPNGDQGRRNSLREGLELLGEAVDPPPDNLLPLIAVDERSIACASCVSQSDWNAESDHLGPAPCEIVRWHLGVVPQEAQGAVLDVDAGEYLDSVAEELAERLGARERILRVAQDYQVRYVSKGERPRAHVLRPIQLACQNVVIGMATIEQDAQFDGLRVVDYVTCEVSHLATHEADRALAALILCDAFRNGGTMEVRFGAKGRERAVPPALRRLGRSIGLGLGEEDPCAITPLEARRLFLAVTPMEIGLRERYAALIDRGGLAPERVCYTLMAGIWSAPELDYILATSSRSLSILSGGGELAPTGRILSEYETCRAAIMIGTLIRRLSNADRAAGDSEGVRIFEDANAKVRWSVLDDVGAVLVDGDMGQVPWLEAGFDPGLPQGPLLIVPRGLPVPGDAELVAELAAQYPDSRVFLLCTRDLAGLVSGAAPLLIHPDRLREVDLQVEQKLLSMRVGRA